MHSPKRPPPESGPAELNEPPSKLPKLSGEGVTEDSNAEKSSKVEAAARKTCGSSGCPRNDDPGVAKGDQQDANFDDAIEEAEPTGANANAEAISSLGSEENGGDKEVQKCVLFLPKHWQHGDLKAHLQKLGVTFVRAKKARGQSTGFVTFAGTAAFQKGQALVECAKVGKRAPQLVDVRPRGWENKKAETRSHEPVLTSGQPGGEKGTPDDAAPEGGLLHQGEEGEVLAENADAEVAAKEVWQSVTPLANVPYQEQLQQKQQLIATTLRRIVRKARKAMPAGQPLPAWIQQARKQEAMACPLEGILESPLVEGYRNKCEFSIGLNRQGKRTVGFQLGAYKLGCTAVEAPDDCKNVSPIAKAYARIVQEFIESSCLPVWDKRSNIGMWRQLTVREGRAAPVAGEEGYQHTAIKEVMLVAQVNPSGVDEVTLAAETERLKEHVLRAANDHNPPLPLTALLIQHHVGVSNAAPADAPLIPLLIETEGEDPRTIIYEHMCNLRFQISPTAFFQVNTPAAERLYQLAGEWAGLSKDTLLFDVCCGTGTIGLTLAHCVGKVVGIELNAAAVKDAKVNARLNNISNAEFVAGKAEEVLGRMLQQYASQVAPMTQAKGSASEVSTLAPATEGEAASSAQQFTDVVAIVDPPRSGLHPSVLRALRGHARLRRIVYVSCNPETLALNAVELCTPTSGEKAPGRAWVGELKRHLQQMPKSEPFSPVKAMAVDLFPHTPHCEMVLLLER